MSNCLVVQAALDRLLPSKPRLLSRLFPKMDKLLELRNVLAKAAAVGFSPIAARWILIRNLRRCQSPSLHAPKAIS